MKYTRMNVIIIIIIKIIAIQTLIIETAVQ
jgi:hypothetical protein